MAVLEQEIDNVKSQNCELVKSKEEAQELHNKIVEVKKLLLVL